MKVFAIVLLLIPALAQATSNEAPSEARYTCKADKTRFEVVVTHTNPMVFHISNPHRIVVDGQSGWVAFTPESLYVRYHPEDGEVAWIFYLNRIVGNMSLRTYNNSNMLVKTAIGTCKRMKDLKAGELKH